MLDVEIMGGVPMRAESRGGWRSRMGKDGEELRDCKKSPLGRFRNKNYHGNGIGGSEVSQTPLSSRP